MLLFAWQTTSQTLTHTQNEGDDHAFSLDPAVLLRTVHANVLGPALVAQAYLPLLERGAKKTVVNVSSGLASVGLACGAKNASYSISKAALNMLVRLFLAPRFHLGVFVCCRRRTNKPKNGPT